MMKYTIALLMWISTQTWGAFNVYEFTDERKAQQFNQLIEELRCPKCQNNNLADSHAPLASDIKNYVYQAVQRGESNEKITAFLISRYGDFITYRPQNWVIWALPTALGALSFGIALMVIYRKRRSPHVEESTSDKASLPSMADIIRQHQRNQS